VRLAAPAAGEDGELAVAPGEEVRIVVEATDGASDEARAGLRDLELLAMQPGGWHATEPARDLGGGRYEAVLRFPAEGLYYLYATCDSERRTLGSEGPVAYVVARRPEAPEAPETPETPEDNAPRREP
jgi:hypothetical protein